MQNRTQTTDSQSSIRPVVSRALRALGAATLLGAIFCAAPLQAADALIGRWIGGTTSLTNYSTYTPVGTHDGVAVGANAGLLAWSADVPAGFSGSSLDLSSNSVAVLITNTATDDLSYTNTFDEGISNRFTAAFWFKGTLGGTWFGKSGNTPNGWKSRPLSPKADFTMRNNIGEGVGSSMTSSNDVNDGAWHHVTCVFDSSGAVSMRKIYVDGVIQKQNTGTTNYSVNFAPGSHLVIGANQGTAVGSAISSFFPGLLYDVRIYNYALTDVGVLQIFTPGGLASSKEITSFTFPGLGSAAIVGTNISITVPFSTVVTNLAPTYADTGVSRTPASGSTQNFATPKIYTITAQDTSTKGYRVTVSNAPISTANDMLSLTWGAYSSSIVGTNVTLYVPPGTVVTALNPTVTVSPFATVSPLSGATNNFTTPVNYTVTAENGIATKTYLVTVGQANFWTNNAGGVWTTATDWDPNVVPTSAATTILGFNTAGTYTSTHDLGDGFQLNQLVFGAPALTLDGQSLQFAGTAPAIVQSSAAAVTILNGLDLGTGTTVGGAGAGAVTISNGVVSGGTLTKLSSGTLTLSGANTYSGGTIVSNGTLVVGAQTAMGIGPVTLAGGITMKTVNFEGFGPGGNLDNAIVLSGGLVNMDVTFSTAKDIWFAGVVSGPGGMFIQGGIRGVTLSSNNTFSGGVTVTADNRVVVTHTNGLGTGALHLVNTARAHLAYTGDHTVTSLTFGGVAQPNGTYGSTNSDADVGDNVHFVDSGTGTITVGLHKRAKLLTFVFPSLPATTIDQTNRTVSVTVPFATVVTNLAPTYTVSLAATGTPGSGATGNFTTPQLYTIISEDLALTNVYTVTVTKLSAATGKDILTFGPGAVIAGTNINWAVPLSANVTILAPTYTTSPSATGLPGSGATVDFTSPQNYTITAEDLTTKIYRVTATPTSGVVPNGSFETPSLGAGNSQFNPGGAGWSFTANAGIAANGSGWFAPVAPDGVQGGLIQGAGESISQSVDFTAGDYSVTFSVVGGVVAGSCDLSVEIDGLPVHSLTAAQIGTNSWASFTSTNFTLTAGAHTLAFVAGAGGDADMIDKVSFSAAAASVPQPTLTGITGPVTGQFTINGSTDIAGNVVTLKTPSLSAPVTWTPIQTNAVPGGAFNFLVPQGTNARAFYRLMGQ